MKPSNFSGLPISQVELAFFTNLVAGEMMRVDDTVTDEDATARLKAELDRIYDEALAKARHGR